MTVAIYGGSFNPPHPAHVRAAKTAYDSLRPEHFIVMPAAEPPHKAMASGSPDAAERLELTRIAFRGCDWAEVSDLELRRGGASYTSDTVRELMDMYPGAEIALCMGADMLLSFELWHEARWLLENCRLAVMPREDGEADALRRCAQDLRGRYGARIDILDAAPMPMSSSDIRSLLRERRGDGILDGEVYARIIRRRSYGAKPSLPWLREQVRPWLKASRVPHVLGCEQEAVRLAERWDADPDEAAEAGILHDITKKLSMPEQLLLAEKYGIVFDKFERENLKLTHAVTGAAVARDLFGVDDEVYSAIRWHTTARPGMTLLDKIIYMADYIEPTRDFPGVDGLRELAYRDLDRAMELGLEMSLQELREKGTEPHTASVNALLFFRKDETR